ncbi:MAG TPA: riboflavin synthase [Desulfurivibrionaceae bacterium]|nr:riboflavin synthase [Desulfurivibrionaceae bacterium]
MFTGIILGKGTIFEKRPAGGGMLFGIAADFDLPEPEEGESIAVNGVCLTAKEIKGRRFLVDVSPESLSRTNLGRLTTGSVVNLERALRLNDRLGGHMVSGHVDATTEVLEKKPLGDFVLFTFAVPQGFGRYIIEKGSIAIDGISLTVNHVDDKTFSVSIIPQTLMVTTLGAIKAGDRVNIEVDLIGKYVEKLLAAKDAGGEHASRINPAFLAEHGFLK